LLVSNVSCYSQIVLKNISTDTTSCHWHSCTIVNCSLWEVYEKGQYANSSTSWTHTETQFGKNPTLITSIVT